MGERWERLEGEPNRWWQRFERFRVVGPDRSILAVFNEWRLAKSRNVSRSAPKTWRERALEWQWRERAEAWDEHCRARASAEAEAERLRILSTGYAQQHERVRSLDGVAALLLEELRDDDKRWLPDVKSIGSGVTAERVDIVRFNAQIIEQFRKTLEDIAAEMGERVQQHKIQIDQPPLVVIDK